MPQRMGTCNQCGECCGSVDAPNPHNPFPNNWPEALRHWTLESIGRVLPPQLLGIIDKGDERGYLDAEGTVRIRNLRFYYVWVPGGGCCKDTSVAHDGSSHNTECPFLDVYAGAGAKPCGLIGENWESFRQSFCRPETHPDYIPEEDLWNQRSIDQWQADHPSCSYTFEE